MPRLVLALPFSFFSFNNFFPTNNSNFNSKYNRKKVQYRGYGNYNNIFILHSTF